MSGLRSVGTLAGVLLCACIAANVPAAATPAPQAAVEELAARAERFESQAKWDEAAAAYREILKIDPRSIAALNRLGALEVRRGRFDAGIGSYRQALAVNPAEFATNLNLGIAYVKKQDYRSAIPPLERAASAAPDDFQARELLAAALVGQNNYAAAIPHLERASQLSPRDVATLYLLERCYLEMNQFEKALAGFERLRILDADSPWLRILRGQAEDGMGNYQQAIEEFEAARRQLPSDATVRFSLGFMYWKTRRLADAESELRQTLQLDPQFEEAKFYLADTYLLEEKPDAALRLLAGLARRQPRNARVLADQGKALEKLRRDEEAARAYEACVRADPARADAHYRLARVYKRLNRSADSAREFTVAGKLRQEKLEEQETLVRASGAHGSPTLPAGDR